MATSPLESQWKDPAFLATWRRDKRKKIDEIWRRKWQPLLENVALVAELDQGRAAELRAAAELTLLEGETILERARRLEHKIGEETRHKSPVKLSGRSRYSVPASLGKDPAGDFVVAPWARRARPSKSEKAKFMHEAGLAKKAQREIACGILGAAVVCKSGHLWRVTFKCGNRYCETCGPDRARRLFASSSSRLYKVAARILCDGHAGEPCPLSQNRATLPHWPPARGTKRPPRVVAKIDFLDLNTGRLPQRDEISRFNREIKKFFRTCERRFGFTRRDYGVAWCDEFGGANTNLHAHAVYVGPWLPQLNRELSAIWAEVTGGRARIVSIKYARDFPTALYHAIKYPAKFAELSRPRRLAELEQAFHGVRRFHTLGAFYAAEADDDTVNYSTCPTCGEPLSQIQEWRPLAEVENLRDALDAWRQLARARVFGPSPPA